VVVVHLLGLNKDAEFAAGLNSEGFVHARKSASKFFEIFDPLQVSGHRFGTSAWARGADGIGGAD